MIATAPPANAVWSNNSPFVSLGPRIPAYVISPLVKPGSVCHDVLDHTSVLKFLGEKFGKNGSYSPLVDARQVQSISAALNFDSPVTNAPAAPSLIAYLAGRPPTSPGATVPPPNTKLQQGFQQAVTNLRQGGADSTHPKFGNLLAELDKLLPP